MTLMEIDIEKLDDMVKYGDSILFSPEAEELLVKFYEIKKQIEEAELKIKKKIEEAGGTAELK